MSEWTLEKPCGILSNWKGIALRWDWGTPHCLEKDGDKNWGYDTFPSILTIKPKQFP